MLDTLIKENPEKFRVLIVDDTPDNIWMLANLLKQDYAILAAKNGETALELVHREHAPDLILLDVLMPDMDGYEVCSRLKSEEATRNIPVIFVTSQDDSGHEERGLGLGAVDYIGRPFVPSLVKARVHAQLELKRHRDGLNLLVRERTRELELTQRFIINALANLAEWRDTETGDHIQRTRRYVEILVDELQKEPTFSEQLSGGVAEIARIVAPLHDIGKVCVPDAILQKPGRLTPEEYETMKQHTSCARNVLNSAGEEIGNHVFLRVAKDLVYSHHERWDGKGYPDGLSGEEIPLVARIMAIADVYDALSSRRVYKPAFSHEESVKLVREGKGTQFDPVLVETFMQRETDFARISREAENAESAVPDAVPD